MSARAARWSGVVLVGACMTVALGREAEAGSPAAHDSPKASEYAVFFGTLDGARFGCHYQYYGPGATGIVSGRIGGAIGPPAPTTKIIGLRGSFLPSSGSAEETEVLNAGGWTILGVNPEKTEQWTTEGWQPVSGYREYPLPKLSGGAPLLHSTLYLRGTGEIVHYSLAFDPLIEPRVIRRCSVDWVFNGQQRSAPPRNPPKRKWTADPASKVRVKAQVQPAVGSTAWAAAPATVTIPRCTARTLCFGATAGSAPNLLVRSRQLAGGRVAVLYLPLGERGAEVWSLGAGETAANARSWLVPEAPPSGVSRVGFVDLVGYASPPAPAAATADWETPHGKEGALAEVWPTDEVAVSNALPPPAGPWLTTPAIPGFRFKARLAGSNLVAAGSCPPQTLCLAPDRTVPAEVFAQVTARQANGKRWVLIGKFADAPAQLWVQQGTAGPVRQYSLAVRPPDSSWLPGIIDRKAFGG
jgi:hypothetical protein